MTRKLTAWQLPDESVIAVEIPPGAEVRSMLTHRSVRRFTFDSVKHELVQDDEGEWSEWLILINAKPRRWTSLKRWLP